MNSKTFDYVVVGAGSSGAIVATRLSEDPNVNVLLVEAGPEDKSIWSKIPAGFGKILFNPKYMWGFPSAPEPHLNRRQVGLPHGKVLGGSSAINGLVYVRGFPLDYDTWAEKGATGWSYKDVLPHFINLERNEDGANAFRGDKGPIGVERARWSNPFADAAFRAISEQGVPLVPDFASHNAEGAGYWQLTTWKGRRSSTSEAFIKPNRNRPNLTIVTEALAQRIMFEGKRAVGIVYEQNGTSFTVRAGREVILSAGALHSPQILQLSGVGPASLLQDKGIQVLHDLPGVGENLMDHVQYGRIYTTNSPHTFNRQLNSLPGYVKNGIRYFLGGRTGPIAIGASLGGGYIRLMPEEKAPDLHFHLIPFRPGEKGWDLAPGSGFRFGMYQNRPESRGHVRIRSADPKDVASVVFNHLDTEHDRRTVLAAMRFTEKVAKARALAAFDVKEVVPGPGVASDDEIMAFVRQTADTGFHFSGTAKMGTDSLAVVDPKLKVHGIEGLRVIDASVMPTIVSGNTNAAALMIGEKGAALVKADQH